MTVENPLDVPVSHGKQDQKQPVQQKLSPYHVMPSKMNIGTNTITKNDENTNDDNVQEGKTNNENFLSTSASSSSTTIKSLPEVFDKNGFFILSQFLKHDAILEWESFCKKYFTKCFETLHQKGHIDVPVHNRANYNNNSNNTNDIKKKYDYVLGLGAKHGFREIVMRSPGRYELSLLHLLRNDNSNNASNVNEQTKSSIPPLDDILEPLSKVITSLLAEEDKTTQITLDDLKLCHLSLILATPGSTEQGWHADGGHVNVLEHLPCHCLNVFIPLQDVSLDMGPTEFRPGTHYHTRNLAPMMLAAKCRKTLKAPFTSKMQVGDVLIFDYRVLHRGKANFSLKDRNFLVLTFCKPWFQDLVNFPKRSMFEPSTSSDPNDIEQS